MYTSETSSPIRLRKTNIWIAAFATIALVLTFCVNSNQAQATQSISAPQARTVAASSALSATDIELIDGVLFGVGPVADKIGNTIDAFISSADDLAAVKANLVTARDAFVAVKTPEASAAIIKIRSGSINTVTSGLEDLGKAFNEYIEETYTTKELSDAIENVEGVAVVPMCGAVAVCAAAVAVAVYAGAIVHNAAAITAATAVVVAAALWCGAWVWCGKSAAPVGSERVLQEKFLAQVTRVATTLPA